MFLKIFYRFYRKFIIIFFKSYDSFFNFEKNTGYLYTRIKARVALGYWINLSSPKTFNEKGIHRRLFSRDDIWPIITNKNTVREWLEDKRFSKDIKFTSHIKISSLEEMLEYKVTKPVVIKAAWGSGTNLFIKNQSDFEDNKVKLKQWFYEPYKVESLIWASTQMKRDFIIEDMLVIKDSLPIDIKLFCFSGKVLMLQTEENRFKGSLAGALFSRDGKLMDVNYKGVSQTEFTAGIEEKTLNKAIGFAETVSADFDFLRVDLFLHDKELYFAELSQTPHAGFKAFTRREFDEELGNQWDYQI